MCAVSCDCGNSTDHLQSYHTSDTNVAPIFPQYVFFRDRQASSISFFCHKTDIETAFSCRSLFFPGPYRCNPVSDDKSCKTWEPFPCICRTPGIFRHLEMFCDIYRGGLSTSTWSWMTLHITRRSADMFSVFHERLSETDTWKFCHRRNTCASRVEHVSHLSEIKL